MRRAHAALIFATSLAAISGLAYSYVAHVLPATDEFSAYHHPSQPYLSCVHYLAAPILIFALGWTFGEHALAKLARGAHARRSGLASLATAAATALSGALLPTISEGHAHVLAAWVHALSGIAFAATLAAHALRARAHRRIEMTTPESPEWSASNSARERKPRQPSPIRI